MTERGLRAGNRRLVAVVAMGLLALGGLSACRSDAGSAAFVGSSRITDAEVNATAASLPSKANISIANARLDAAEFLTFNELASRYAHDKGYGTIPAPTLDDLSSLGTSLQIPEPSAAAKNKFVLAIADANAWRNLLLTKTPPIAPTDADLREVFDTAVNAGVIPQGTAFADAKATLQSIQGLGQAVALRKDLVAAAKKYDLSVNPRYSTTCTATPCTSLSVPLLSIPLQDGSSLSAIFLPIGGDANPAVLDVPSPATQAPIAAPAGS